METEPKWLSRLRELDVSKTVFNEFDGNSQDCTTSKNILNRLISVNKNILIIQKESFIEFYKSDYPFKIGALDNLLIQTPKSDFFLNQLKEQYHIPSAYSYITRNGVVKDLPKVGLRYNLSYDKSKLSDEELDNHNYNIFALGENLAFNKIKFIEEIKTKDSKCILFTMLEKLEIFVFFLDSYWEVKRTPPPMTFNEFVGNENENKSISFSDTDKLLDEINEILEYKKPKKSFFGIFPFSKS
jgi:hypothetical protein